MDYGGYKNPFNKTDDDHFREALITELHDIALSLKAMSGRNVVKTNEPQKNKGYVERYFERSDPKDDTADSR